MTIISDNNNNNDTALVVESNDNPFRQFWDLFFFLEMRYTIINAPACINSNWLKVTFEINALGKKRALYPGVVRGHINAKQLF